MAGRRDRREPLLDRRGRRGHGRRRRRRADGRRPAARRARRCARRSRSRRRDGLFAVVATAGTTNLGIVDDLAGVAEVCAEHGLWFHVDGAYGAAALAAPSARPHFAGIERADSLIVDPHKWLFAPFDCCALLYRDPELGARGPTSRRRAISSAIQRPGEWNPSDYALHLSRRARGLPFWFSLAATEPRAYSEAIERTLAVARAAAADDVRARDYLELVREPDLSVSRSAGSAGRRATTTTGRSG